jgi:hypothetical protein
MKKKEEEKIRRMKKKSKKRYEGGICHYKEKEKMRIMFVIARYFRFLFRDDDR